MNYVYGPIPSRRLGKSLGISPIQKKTCNLACVYCMLGKTDKMTNESVDQYPLEDILDEVKLVLDNRLEIDIISIVGEGEPTLYARLDELVSSIKTLTNIPVAVITNATRLTEASVYQALLKADFVLPSVDAYDETSFKKINRPEKSLNYQKIIDSLIKFSHEYQGELWVETMICKGYNDTDEAVDKLKSILRKIKYQRLYINSPIRPPALETVKALDHQRLDTIAKKLGGINIDVLADPKFYSDIKNDLQAILSIIKRHPMNQFEINAFLDSRNTSNKHLIYERLTSNDEIEVINYKGFNTYRFK